MDTFVLQIAYETSRKLSVQRGIGFDREGVRLIGALSY